MEYLNERIDYIKWVDYETASTLHDTLEAMEHCARTILTETGEVLDWGYVFTGKEQAGYGVYLFEVRGSSADTFVQRFTNKVNWHNLRRLDYRVEVPCEDETFRLWRLNRAANPDKARNYNAFNTRKRAKTDDRDRGGYGLAIGSLKSEIRITTYQERPGILAVEWQFRGKKAGLIGRDVIQLTESRGEKAVRNYSDVMRVVVSITDDQCYRLFGEPLSDFCAFFSIDPSVVSPPPEVSVEDLVDQLQSLDRAERKRFVQLFLDLVL